MFILSNHAILIISHFHCSLEIASEVLGKMYVLFYYLEYTLVKLINQIIIILILLIHWISII